MFESGVVKPSEQPEWILNLRCGHGGEDENENVGKLPSEDEGLCDVHDGMGGSEEEKGSEKADRSVEIDRGSDSGGWVHSGLGCDVGGSEKEPGTKYDGDFGEGRKGGEGVSLISVELIDTSSCPGFGEEKLRVEVSLSSVVSCSISSGGSEGVLVMRISVTIWNGNANEGEETDNGDGSRTGKESVTISFPSFSSPLFSLSPFPSRSGEDGDDSEWKRGRNDDVAPGVGEDGKEDDFGSDDANKEDGDGDDDDERDKSEKRDASDEGDGGGEEEDHSVQGL